jgi:hypothetical protein
VCRGGYNPTPRVNSTQSEILPQQQPENGRSRMVVSVWLFDVTRGGINKSAGLIPHAKNHSKYVPFLALLLSTFGATVGSPLRAANSRWENLRILRPGQQIRVVLNDAKFYQGELLALNTTQRHSVTLHRWLV